MIGLADTILLSFNNRETWLNVSHIVKYDSLSITSRAFNDDYRLAQNTADFTLIYDEAIFAQLYTAIDDIYVYITSAVLGPTLGSITLGESTLANTAPLFSGHFLPSYSRTYNGILDNTQISITATDSADLLDVPAGDIVYRSTIGNQYTICNPANASLSILHQLVAEADPLMTVDINLVIPIELEVFAPPSLETPIKDCIDLLLHEHGYAWRMNEFDDVTATKWQIEAGEPLSHTYTDADTTYDLTEQVTAREHDGVIITYYNVEQGVTLEGSTDLLVYRDSNIPYDNDIGGFFGYPIPGNATYPPETNVVDDTDPPNKVKVFQEYTNDSIQYFTNKAVVNKLDFNRNAFTSDFSAMVATFDHRLVWDADVGVNVILEEYGNKQARVIFENTSVDFKKLYYFNIWSKVYYKTAERKAKAGNVLAPDRRLYKYEMTYCCTKECADKYAQHRAELFAHARSVYTFSDSEIRPVGSYVGIQLADGTDDTAMVMARTFDGATNQFRYALKKHTTALATLLSQSEKALSTYTAYSPQYNGTYKGAYTTPPGV